MPGKKQ